MHIEIELDDQRLVLKGGTLTKGYDTSEVTSRYIGVGFLEKKLESGGSETKVFRWEGPKHEGYSIHNDLQMELFGKTEVLNEEKSVLIDLFQSVIEEERAKSPEEPIVDIKLPTVLEIPSTSI